MIYKAVDVIQIFGAGRTDGRTNEGVPRGPRGPKNATNKDALKKDAMHRSATAHIAERNTYVFEVVDQG